MSRVELYRRLHRNLMSVMAIGLILGGACAFFFAAKKVKMPMVTFSFMEHMNECAVKSVLIDALGRSCVAHERLQLDRLQHTSGSGGPENRERYVYTPFFEVLVDRMSGYPLEARLFSRDHEVPFITGSESGMPEESWRFVQERSSLYRFDASEMNVFCAMIDKRREGIFMAVNGFLRQSIELPGGMTEFAVTAASRPIFKTPKDFDSSAHMKMMLDGSLLKDVYVPGAEFNRYSLQTEVPPGWHKLEVEFDNDVYDPGKKWDRNLLVKEVGVSSLKGVVHIATREGDPRDLATTWHLAYFRVVYSAEENELIRFFKKRFSIDDLAQAASRANDPKILLRDVDIGTQTRRAVFAPAPTTLRFPYRVPADGIKLVFGFGIMEEAWNKPGDGVEFRIQVETGSGGNQATLFSQYIDPKRNAKHRKWVFESVDLSKYAGKDITLVFETQGGMVSSVRDKFDTQYDYAVWSS